MRSPQKSAPLPLVPGSERRQAVDAEEKTREQIEGARGRTQALGSHLNGFDDWDDRGVRARPTSGVSCNTGNLPLSLSPRDARTHATETAATTDRGAARGTVPGEAANSADDGSGEADQQAEQVPEVQAQVSAGRELLQEGWCQAMSRNSLSALRKLYERGRRILLAVRTEFGRRDESGTNLNPDYIDNPGVSPSAAPATPVSPADAEPIDVGFGIEKASPGGGRRPIERSTRAVAPRHRGSRDSVGRPDLDGTRRSVVEVKATGKRTGIIAKGKRNDYSHLTLTAIQAAKDELWAKGQMPDGMILREDEVRFLMEKYFGAKPGDPIPRQLEIMGLPVKVSD